MCQLLIVEKSDINDCYGRYQCLLWWLSMLVTQYNKHCYLIYFYSLRRTFMDVCYPSHACFYYCIFLWFTSFTRNRLIHQRFRKRVEEVIVINMLWAYSWLANSLLFFAKSNGEFAHIINTLFTLLKKKISVVLILLFESDMHFPVQGNLVCTVRLNLWQNSTELTDEHSFLYWGVVESSW